MFELMNCHALEGLRALEPESVDCIVTSPPYWGLRDYGVDGQIGLEPTLQEFMGHLAEVFAECWRVLKPSGTMWVNMGDSYCTGAGAARKPGGGTQGKEFQGPETQPNRVPGSCGSLQPKSLIGQPWRLALMLQDAGWILRRDIIWHKPAAMPESCKDRATTSHEYLFHFVKESQYFYDFDAVSEPCTSVEGLSSAERVDDAQRAFSRRRSTKANPTQGEYRKPVAGWDTGPGDHSVVAHAAKTLDMGGPNSKFRKNRVPGGNSPQSEESRLANGRAAATELMGRENSWREQDQPTRRNQRSVWTIASEPYKAAHFATFPSEIPRRCIRAGCPPGGVVLDIFAGSGTTLAVALEEGRRAIGIELNPEYCDLIRQRISMVTPSLFLQEGA